MIPVCFSLIQSFLPYALPIRMAEAAEMGPQKAGELAGKVMTRVDELAKKDQPRTGIVTFNDVYDLEKLEPRPEYTAALDRAQAELSNLGVPLRS